MVFEGKVSRPRKGERYWLVKVPDLGVFTQGRSEKDAYAMAADAIETVADRKDFAVTIEPVGAGRFLVSANDPRPLIARWLFRMRSEKGLSLRELAARMGASSSEAWARYESGRASPTVEKLAELLEVVEPESRYVIRKVTSPGLKKAS